MSEAPVDRGHARLAPSSAGRWTACPGSVALEAQLPDPPSSDAAMEGTAAHELAAHCLKRGHYAKDFIGRKIDVNGRDILTIFLAPGAPGGHGVYTVDAEMAEHVQAFIDIVRNAMSTVACDVHIERRVYAKNIHESDVHGTADAMVYNGVSTTLDVFDLKFGRGVVVEVEDNKQLGIYASGARTMLHNRNIGRVRVHIFQPRASHEDGAHRTVSYTPAELDAFEVEMQLAVSVVEAAEAAFDGDITDEWQEQYLTAGDHCRFCKVAATCPERAKAAVDFARTEFGDTTELEDVELMDPDRLAEVLTKARQIQHWIKSVEEYAHACAVAGKPPTGWKLVAGRNSYSWHDEEKLAKLLPVFVDVDTKDLYHEPTLMSPARVKKLLSKDERTWLESFIKTTTGGATLVPESDKRQAVKPSASDEFSSVELDD